MGKKSWVKREKVGEEMDERKGVRRGVGFEEGWMEGKES